MYHTINKVKLLPCVWWALLSQSHQCYFPTSLLKTTKG